MIVRSLRFKDHVIPLWLIAIILLSGTGGVLAYYVWTTLTLPFQVKEPIEIVHYPSKLDLFPGENSEFAIEIQNHASMNYSVTLNFYLSNETYQNDYVTFSNQIYVVQPGRQNLTCWLRVEPEAPAVNASLAIDFIRGSWISEKLQISSVSYPTSSSIKITMQNIGEETATIAKIRVNNTQTWDGEIAIQPGYQESVTLNYSWVQDRKYQVEVITTLGNKFHYLSVSPMEESLHLLKLHIWHNGTTFSEAAFLMINTGFNDITVDKISVRGQECTWSTIYYNRTADPITQDLPYLAPNNNETLLGKTVNIASQNYSIVQAYEDLILHTGQGMIIYITNPDSISVNDIGLTVGVTFFTTQAQYYRECNIGAAQ